MIGSPRMQIWVLEELAEASDLTAEEYGAYVLLRLYQWQYGSLPVDDDRLPRVAHVVADRWPAVSDAIRSRFGENWIHEATTKAVQKSAITHQLLSEAGRKGGRSNRPQKSTNHSIEGQAASQAASPASSPLKPNLSHGQSKAEAPLPAKTGDQTVNPECPDPESGPASIQERCVHPSGPDNLQLDLLESKPSPSIHNRS